MSRRETARNFSPALYFMALIGGILGGLLWGYPMGVESQPPQYTVKICTQEQK